MKYAATSSLCLTESSPTPPQNPNPNNSFQVGCGLGLPALAASLHAASVVASDFSPQTIQALDECIAFNRQRQPPAASAAAFAKVRGAVVDWTHVLAAEQAGPSIMIVTGQTDELSPCSVCRTRACACTEYRSGED